jgi:cytochrome P450
VPQSALTERVVDGFRIPAKTNFVINSDALNIQNSYWGDERNIYRPERFLELKSTELRDNYWRFGFGPRQCMGKYVADLIIQVLMLHVAECYELSLVTNKDVGRIAEIWIDHPQIKLSCKSIL